MQTFTGIEYIKIDIANQFGFDKLRWDERIQWATTMDSCLEDIVEDAKDPILYAKAVMTLRDAQRRIPTGYMIGLDATASGLQIMACLIGCHKTAANVNLINTGYREDVYQKVADVMTKLTTNTYEKDQVKYPVMTTFYGSKKQPKDLFGDKSPELHAFIETLNEELTGAMECMEDMQGCWQPEALEHQWTLPDGHVACVKVEQPVDRKIEIDEYNHATFTFRSYENIPAPKGLSLAANIIHSIDGYIVREMVRKADKQGFYMLHIHDSFWASPNHMNKVRQNYLDILMEITDSDLLEHILREITGNNELKFIKLSDNLCANIQDAEYALS